VGRFRQRAAFGEEQLRSLLGEPLGGLQVLFVLRGRWLGSDSA